MKFIRGFLKAVFAFFALFIGFGLILGNSESSSGANAEDNKAEVVVEQQDEKVIDKEIVVEPQAEEKNLILYDDGQFKVSYLGIIDYKDMYPGEQDMGQGISRCL